MSLRATSEAIFHGKYLPLFLVVVLYILIFLVRYQQGGWEVKFDLWSSVRESIDQRISQTLPSPQAELLSGILLGQNKQLPPELRLAFRDTSTLHIVVASGQNLSLLAGFFLNLAGLIKRKNAILLSLLAVIFYTLLSGVQVPILRAAVMFSLAAGAQLYGRQNLGWQTLIITAGLMLLVNPRWISDLSFQLSFLATFGVVVVAPILLRYLNKFPLLGADLAVTLGAQIMVSPVIIQSFHQLSLVGVITNLLVGWTVPFIMVLGTLLIFTSLIFSGLAFVFSIASSVLLTYFIYIVYFFASLSFAWEYVGEQVWIVWVGYYMVVAAIVLLLKNVKTANSARSSESS
ncbi:ComEC/Rec2 family competence protein [Candidatus Daviesbacteria bacterium]|nr:ComEC/Rec2 family competence protein [Candidatus Daviesbacteria bacterium]